MTHKASLEVQYVDVWQRTLKEAGLLATLSRHCSLLLLVHLRALSQSDTTGTLTASMENLSKQVEQAGLTKAQVAIPKAGMLLPDVSLHRSRHHMQVTYSAAC